MGLLVIILQVLNYLKRDYLNISQLMFSENYIIQKKKKKLYFLSISTKQGNGSNDWHLLNCLK